MRKNIIILFSILVACILVLVGINLAKKIKKSSKPKVTFAIEKIDNFVIDSRQGNFSFIKESGEWKIEFSDAGTVEKCKADQDMVKQFLEKANHMELLDIVTENKDRFVEFQVDQASGTKTRLYNGKKLLASFIMGKPCLQIDYQKSYFKFDNKNQVWITKGLDPWILTRDSGSWRDKSVMKLPKERITQIEIKHSGKPKDNVLLTKTSDYWLIAGTNKKANAEKVKGMVDTLSELSTDAFAGKDKKFGKTTLEITVKVDNTTENLTFGEKITSQFPFQRNHSKPTYLMYEFRYTPLKLTKADLLK